MLQLLFDFFYENVFTYESMPIIEYNITLFGGTIQLDEYLSFLCALISVIFIVVLCCLFVYKIIKLIGGLIR